MTLSDVNGLALDTDEAAQALHMTEEAFRAFYERTARPLWAYLARATGEPHTADDLLQDAYYRLLRSTVTFDDDAHRRNYLFRIATNLVRDRHRRPSREVALPDDESRSAALVRRRRAVAVRRTAGDWPGPGRACGRATATCCGWPIPRASRMPRWRAPLA